MARKGDIIRAQSVNAEFDGAASGTSLAGAILVERVFRRMGLRRAISDHLLARSESATFSTTDIVYALMAGLMVGGRGLTAGEALRLNEQDVELFGLERGVPSEATVHNALADLSGLERRSLDQAYGPAGVSQPSLRLFGEVKHVTALRRIVPDTPESASASALSACEAFTSRVGRRCLEAIPHAMMYLDDYEVVFGDATDLEVEGRCFDAARMDRDGHRSLQWATLMAGPVMVAQHLGEGARHEPDHLEGLIGACRKVIQEFRGKRGVLGFLDAAYFERLVVEACEHEAWKYIICANKIRSALEREVQFLDAALWRSYGPDASRGWREVQFYAFAHHPQGWRAPVTIVASRWLEANDLSGSWHYRFLATNLCAGDLPKSRVKEYGFGRYIWMLYGTKQGRENHYKTALEDFGLHHPPSGRLGINQVFYTLAVAASNLAMVIRYRVAKGQDRGITFWPLAQRAFSRTLCAAGGVSGARGADADGAAVWRGTGDALPGLVVRGIRRSGAAVRPLPNPSPLNPQPIHDKGAPSLSPTESLDARQRRFARIAETRGEVCPRDTARRRRGFRAFGRQAIPEPD
jgi:hypothetical protein